MIAGGPLAGKRVIDLSWGMPGGLAGMTLADYGADVIKVERPGGDPARQLPSSRAWDRGKRSIVVDLKSAEGTDTLETLLASADIVIESFSGPARQRFCLEPEEVQQRHPALVHCSITGYGTVGEWIDRPGYDALVAARLGLMAEQPGHRSGPVFLGFPLVSYGTALLSAIGVSAALFARLRTGRGQHVDVSLLDGALAMSSMTWWWSQRGAYAVRTPPRPAKPVAAKANGDTPKPKRRFAGNRRLIVKMFQCADGEYVYIHTGSQGAFGRAMKLFGLDDRVKVSASKTDLGETLTEEESAVVESEMPKILASRARSEWLELLWENDIAAQPVLHPGEVLLNEQVVHNGMAINVDDPVLGPVVQAGPPLKFSRTPVSIARPAPLLDEHREEIQAELTGVQADTAVGAGPSEGRDTARHPDPALHGVRVLDLGAYFAGPYASRLLADLGADVIKVEPIYGDPVRSITEVCAAGNRGKRSIAVDLKADSGRQVLLDLVASADVMHHNMRPGVAERLGIGAADLGELNDQLIYCYAPGFGSTGPLAGLPCFAPLLGGMGGAEFLATGAGNPPLSKISNALEDYFGGLVGALGIVLALLDRARTGTAQAFESSQLNAMVYATTDVMLDSTGAVLGGFELDSGQMGWGPFYRLYQTSDAWICVAATGERQWRLLEQLGLAAQARAGRAGELRSDESELAESIATRIAESTSQDVFQELDDAGIPCEIPAGRECVDAFFFRDAQLDVGRVVEEDHPAWGRIREVGQLIRLSDTPGVNRGPSPEAGAQTREILIELGRSDAEIEALEASGTIRHGAVAAGSAS